MRPQRDQVIRHSGSLNGHRQKMTISDDPESLRLLMQRLTDLYEDPEMATIREPASNAYDAHIAARNPDPIQITLPTDLNPTYVVEDRGVGMSVDDILDVFAKYGESTKRDNDEEVGMMGFGCKAPLTYTHQFTVTAIKNGVKTEVLVTRDEDDINVVEIIDTSATDEPNGVVVQIPVHRVRSFVDKARWFFRFWDSGTVLLDGVAPEVPEGTWLDPDILLTTNNYYFDDDIVVMGNVPYRIDYSHRLMKDTHSRAVIWASIGDVTPGNSREVLRYTRRTEEFLDTAREYINEVLLHRAQKDVDEALTGVEATHRALRWKASLPHRLGNALTYRGRKFKANVPVKRGWVYELHDDVAKDKSRAGYVEIQQLLNDQNIVVVGHPTKAVSQSQRKRLNIFAERHDKDVINFFLFPELPDNVWLDGLETVSWEEIASISLPRKQRGSSTPTATYPVLTKHGGVSHVHETCFSADSPLCVIVPHEVAVDSMYNRHVLEIANALDNYTVVALKKNRINKFRREHAVVELEYAFRREAQRIRDALTPRQQSIVKKKVNHRGYNRWLDEIDPTDVDDPDLKGLLCDLSDPSVAAEVEKYSWLLGASASLGEQQTVKSVVFHEDVDERLIEERYPLLHHIEDRLFIRSVTKEEVTALVIDYINMVYQTKYQKGENEDG